MVSHDRGTPGITGLTGRCFHIFGEGQKIDRQGTVLAPVGPGHYLIQYFDFIVGQPSTMMVVSIEAMTWSPKEERSPGSWQFYEDVTRMTDWFERYGVR